MYWYAYILDIYHRVRVALSPFESVRQTVASAHTISLNQNLIFTKKSTFVHACLAGLVVDEDIEELHAAGHDFNSKDAGGRTPLHTAVCLGARKSIVISMVRLGADINARDYRGRTPLCYARLTSSDLYDVLVGIGSNVDMQDVQAKN
jgi:ankyrin repeat protein